MGGGGRTGESVGWLGTHSVEGGPSLGELGRVADAGKAMSCAAGMRGQVGEGRSGGVEWVVSLRGMDSGMRGKGAAPRDVLVC